MSIRLAAWGIGKWTGIKEWSYRDFKQGSAKRSCEFFQKQSNGCFSATLCSIMIRDTVRGMKRDGTRRRQFQFPTKCQVVTLSEKLVVLTFCFKNRTQCCCVWVFLGNVPHFANFQQITGLSCSEKTRAAFVLVHHCDCKVKIHAVLPFLVPKLCQCPHHISKISWHTHHRAAPLMQHHKPFALCDSLWEFRGSELSGVNHSHTVRRLHN